MFGPLDIRVGDQSLPRLHSQKGRWLVALLALRNGSAIQRSWLAGTLWPDSDESQALYYLRRELSLLRKALGCEASRLIVHETHSLRLDLTDAYCDLHAFDE